ncbi:MAG: hypothetical protein ACYCPA_01730 [Acidithiobacillus sp.]
MKLFGLKFGSVPLAATALQAARGNTEEDQSPARIYVNPQVAIALPLQALQAATGANPKNQEVDNLATDDLLGEADVYWTYGKWHDAMLIYEWWIGNNGAGLGNDVAHKYLDCAAKAMDFEAFCRMMEKLIGQNADQAFLQDMAVFGLMRDPSNFDLIGIAEAVDVEESRIISIAQKVVDAEDPGTGTGSPSGSTAAHVGKGWLPRYTCRRILRRCVVKGESYVHHNRSSAGKRIFSDPQVPGRVCC